MNKQRFLLRHSDDNFYQLILFYHPGLRNVYKMIKQSVFFEFLNLTYGMDLILNYML